MDGGRVIADDTPRNIGRLLYEQKNDMFAAMPTPVRVFYGADGAGTCPLTVREGRTWLSRSFPAEPRFKTVPMEAAADTQGESALSLKEVWFRYERNSPDILRGVSAEVPRGSLYAIVGGNGAGKSTTLRAVCGICRPYRGKVKIFGKPVEKYNCRDLFCGTLAMLPQDPKSLFVKKTVREDLEEMTQDQALIREMAATCQIEKFLDAHPYDLSGGEQQRAALAKVLLTDPKLLLLDEPTKGIDSFFKETFAEILKTLQSQGITIVMVSHDVEFCARYADLVSMFFDGQVLTTDHPRRFFGSNSFYTTAANRMSRHVFHQAVTAEDVMDLYRQNKEMGL
jgi:energy-coupling factor transport system ATP-binding protein